MTLASPLPLGNTEAPAARVPPPQPPRRRPATAEALRRMADERVLRATLRVEALAGNRLDPCLGGSSVKRRRRGSGRLGAAVKDAARWSEVSDAERPRIR